MKQKVYPRDIEDYWLQLAQQETRTATARDALHRLLTDIRRLTDRFTIQRTDESTTPGDHLYLRNTRICAAYSLFFGPQTYMRLSYILDDLPPFPETAAPLRILDLGAGTGAATFALLDHLGNRPVHVTALDHSRAALRCLHNAFIQLRPQRFPQAILRTQIETLEAFIPETQSYDIILIHYVLNELPAEARQTLLSRAARVLAPGGRLIIAEPLLHAEGDYMRDLRAYAIESAGLSVLSPCPHQQPCPLDEPCHSVRTWPISRAMQILNTSLHRDVRHLAYVPLALEAPSGRGVPPADAGADIPIRIVAPAVHEKGRSQCKACCSDGRIHCVQLLHRNFDTAGRKQLRHLERGERMNLAELHPAESPDAPAKGISAQDAFPDHPS